MAGFVGVLKDSLRIFLENPLLVVPKLVVAFLYSFAIVFVVKFMVDFFTSTDIAFRPIAASDYAALALALFVLVVDLAALVLDTIVNLMLPLLVVQLRDRKALDFRAAFRAVSSDLWKSFVPIGLVLAVFAALTSAWALVYVLLFGYVPDAGEPEILFLFGPWLLIALAVAFMFYMLFPVSAIERLPVGGSLRRAFTLSVSNWRGVSKALAVSVFLSGLSFAIALALNFISEEHSLVFWAAFIIVRFLTAYIATYMYVLSPVFYLDCVKGAKASGAMA
ncbi:MAG: hypothetical protein HY544_02650 [Candidatus Diapherotrites archaeon]|uniref:Uncharacterized protein n=1 Tax=Candidatus Iainarchaeum sp. TaxID=3101447 RepID=A0A8T3YNH7_9ARCH|nr:hypothetical protein [Candidatus Diapherotrites archaeon]